MPETANRLSPSEEQIRDRAYQIYLSRGAEDGNDVSDWLTAERELKNVSEKELNEKQPKARAATSR